MEPESSLLNSQEPTSCLYPEPDQFSPRSTSHFLKINFYISLPSTPGSSKFSFFPQRFLAKTLYAPLPIRAT